MDKDRGDKGRVVRDRQWIGELGESDRVDEVYLVWRKNKLMARNGRAYLALQVGDRTGRMEARAWERADQLDERLSVNGLIRVRGQVVRYQDHLQLKVDDLLPVPDGPQDGQMDKMADFLPSSSRSIEKMWAELLSLVEGLSDPHLKGLLMDFLGDEELTQRFRSAPAAKTIHHAWRGGLLEHTLSVCGLADAMCRHYQGVLPGLLDRDMVLAGAILHDMGKMWEMDPTTFEYTDEGRLLGHMSLMLVQLDRKIRARNDFPKALALHLEHLLLSHHGELEFGSPKRPKTPEAWVLHYADILDGRMMWMSSLFEDMEPGQWSSFQRLYDRYFWKPLRVTSADPDGAALDADRPDESPSPDVREDVREDEPESRSEPESGAGGKKTEDGQLPLLPGLSPGPEK